MAMAMGRKPIKEIMTYDQNINGGQGMHKVLTMKPRGGTKMPAKMKNGY